MAKLLDCHERDRAWDGFDTKKVAKKSSLVDPQSFCTFSK